MDSTDRERKKKCCWESHQTGAAHRGAIVNVQGEKPVFSPAQYGIEFFLKNTDVARRADSGIDNTIVGEETHGGILQGGGGR